MRQENVTLTHANVVKIYCASTPTIAQQKSPMVKKFKKSYSVDSGSPNNIQADVIILGCSLPGIVTAHKLKRKFGDTMNIVVLDMAEGQKIPSKSNVSFRQKTDDDDESMSDLSNEEDSQPLVDDYTARHYIARYAKELNIALPEYFLENRNSTSLNKLFQHTNGNTVECPNDFHDFTYLNFIEKFELNQYQTLLDHSMKNLFQNKDDTDQERKRLLYYDQTNMEHHICDALLFSTSRDVMRTIVRLVCGASADSVSVLFYLHQCNRTNSSRNHLDGDNTRFREKLLGYCGKHLANKLQQSIADITLPSKPIKEIRAYSDERVILKTMKGETNYVCNLLAMALRPDELHKIDVEDQLLSAKEADVACAMTRGRAKKFAVQYETNFWASQGYSGDILSIKGPIIWAMEKPKLSTTGSLGRYPTLIGYLKVKEGTKSGMTNEEAVLEQLVKLFGSEAAFPVSYKETEIDDVFVPKCGDYVAIRTLTGQVSRKYLEWGTLDIFADGDLAAALQAGHTAYLHLLSCLRPQAQTFEDLCTVSFPTALCEGPLEEVLCHMNYKRGFRMVLYTAVFYIGVRLLRDYMKK
jgi:hypothetical protein